MKNMKEAEEFIAQGVMLLVPSSNKSSIHYTKIYGISCRQIPTNTWRCGNKCYFHRFWSYGSKNMGFNDKV